MAANDEANAYVDQVLEEWAPFVVTVLQEALTKNKLVLSQDLFQSFRWELFKATAEGFAQGRLRFRTHGRWMDMKTIRSFKQVPVDVLEQQFVKELGLNKFKYVPGYAKGSFPSENKAMRRIAWGLSRGILSRKQTKARKWYASNFYGTIGRLIDDLMSKYQEVAGRAVSKPMNEWQGL